jgi:hypothetical protein
MSERALSPVVCASYPWADCPVIALKAFGSRQSPRSITTVMTGISRNALISAQVFVVSPLRGRGRFDHRALVVRG